MNFVLIGEVNFQKKTIVISIHSSEKVLFLEGFPTEKGTIIHFGATGYKKKGIQNLIFNARNFYDPVTTRKAF